jgi:hypothetical protein
MRQNNPAVRNYTMFVWERGLYICGGSSDECLLDIEVCGLSMGVNIRNPKYIYSKHFVL